MNAPEPAEHERLDAALQYAFGRQARLRVAKEPLTSLLPAGEEAPSVLLRDVPAEAPVHLRTSTAEGALDDAGRWHVFGEIARGGVGVILKARDHILGRDVAIKLLDERHRHRPAIVRRFLEEAQIVGQLQHPAIVPVHELGVARDGRPFLVLKLIQGETLSALLAARRDPAGDRPKLLTVFARVCEAMAYAHARGVIHRDLKPSNVMVGAFGEVQVMDFGLAKVLARPEPPPEREPPDGDVARPVETVRSSDPSTASVTGSVLGTYGYMAPEQARGEVESLDARADVFGLGAILFELLTGEGPYGRGKPEELRARATSAALVPIAEQLAAAAVEPSLAELCQRCLAAQPDERPRHAGEVAAALHAFLTALERRARASEQAAVRAQERAESERRARKWQLALAGCVVAVVAVVAAALVWRARDASARALQTEQKVDAALAQALRHRGEAEVSGDAATWTEAVAAAERAVSLAEGDDTHAALRQRAGLVAAEVADAAAQVRARAARDEADRRTRVRLREIAMRAGAQRDWAGADREFAAVFAQHGIDVDAGEPSAIAQRIRGDRLAEDLLAAMFHWQSASKMGELGRRGRLLAIADGADPDPLRTRVRAARAAGDVAQLLAIAEETRAQVLPPTTAHGLAWALDQSGKLDAAADVVRRTWVHHPGDFALHFYLAQVLGALGRDELQDEIAQHLMAALALAPDGAMAANNLAATLMTRGDHATAESLFRRIVERAPSSLAHANLGVLLEQCGRHAEATKEYEAAARLAPDNPQVHCAHARSLRREGRLADADAAFAVARAKWPDHLELLLSHGALLCDAMDRFDEAAQLFVRATELAPDKVAGWRNLAVASAKMGDSEAAVAVWQKVTALEPAAAEPHVEVARLHGAAGRWHEAAAAYRAAIALAPQVGALHADLANALDELGDLDGAIAECRRACDLAPALHGAWHNLGHFLRRAGKPTDALAALRKAEGLAADSAATQHELGLTLLDLGQVDAAIVALERAAAALPEDDDVRSSLHDARRRKGGGN